ncbi:MAG: methyltransferase domain-containing protein [Patescibacteria group bacterium]|nr:methyltransferase domain-containing protein [Patescibacteria group bacterium]
MQRTDFLFQHLQTGKILDVGNLGMDAEIHDLLIKKYSDSQIYGLDVENQAKYGKNYSNQLVGNAEAMPYEDNLFDTIYLGEVLEHTWQPKVLIGECFRVLKPGGVLILDTPNVYALSRLIRYFIIGQDIILGNPDHKIFFSRAMLDNLFKKVGFNVITTMADNKFTLKSKNFSLPRFGALKFQGEHLLGAARKPHGN